MGNNFFYLEKYNLAIENFNEAIKYADHKEARPQFKSSLYAFLGFAYEKATMMDSAIVALEKSEKLYDALKDKEKNKKHIAKVYLSFGDIYSYKQDYATANIYYKKAYAIYIDLPKVSGEFLSSLAQRINAIDNRQH
jgi:tetratricopeptide (TPR) repeat protein